MSAKYEVAPGLFVGSEIGDLNRELKKEMRLYLDGDIAAMQRITKISHQKEQLLRPKQLMGTTK
jgi:hypothetical protein